ncbi:YceI family protein [Saprospira sp. CCB-QB6]|uniref:YceI family protein n=1 Tax=Saprospira sp. CCB-QB6 TaxID=3023936 RepID=UPI00234B4D7E|nr:YceI family protein [Saprospira sp. CCB-QB6]WCL81063.1 YceI family protein [Saprospira sp. CCB-QB6]
MKTLFRSLFFMMALGFFAASCSEAPKGEKVDAQEAKNVDAEKAAEAKTLAVDVASSKVEWVGSKVSGSHNGDMKLQSGELQVKDGQLVGGTFVLDMASINVLDLDEESGKAKLEGHLKNNDFFEVEKFPTATFTITSVSAAEGEEGVTHRIEGNLKMRDIEKSVTIPANVNITDGAVQATTPQFTIKRSVWGIDYSGMEDNLINDEMGLKVTLAAK